MKKVIYLSGICLSLTTPIAYADEQLEEVVVNAHLLSGNGLAQASDVLAGDELTEQLQSSLGETVANTAGVRSASFGGAVGRPVIHGLGGGRVKTTEDRIDSLDVSVTSTDHAVTIEPLIANQISILKGPSTLLYGSGAIGGVVDVETGRIPTALPEEALNGRVELRVADNADARTGALRLDGKAGESVAWHVDAFSKEADDYDFAGGLESAALLRQEGEEDEEQEPGELEGSRYKTNGGAIGASWVGESGYVGLSISSLDSDYGLVGGHGHEEGEEEGEEEEEEEGVGRIDLRQTRVDLDAQLNEPFVGFEKINFRLGVNDYQHDEIEGNGEIGTSFDNQAWEGRIEFTHNPIAGFEGAFGIQLGEREFSALGEEAFVPPVDTESTGLFWVAQTELDSLSLELGARVESTDRTPSLSTLPNLSFSTGSASLGLIAPVSESLTLSALADYTQRAPAVEELYSNGPHLATQTFEVGDPLLDKESALGLTFTLNYQSDVFDARITAYKTDFDDYIFQAGTGEIEDDLPVLEYRQSGASFVGADFEFGFHLAELMGGDFDMTAMFDFVSADIDGGANLPRIPADRQGLSFSWDNEQWRVKLDLSHVSAQDEVAAFELPTDSYSDVSLRLTRRVEIADNKLSLFLYGRNLGDTEQREHVSFVKDFAPAPGRRIEAGVRFQF